jgi:hypothetical protein
MKKSLTILIRLVLVPVFISATVLCFGQSEKKLTGRYLTALPVSEWKANSPSEKLRMTALYVNMDIFGNITGRTFITGDYTRTNKSEAVTWNNVYISVTNGPDGDLNEKHNLAYMENFNYIPTGKMLEEAAFSGFPKDMENVFARNLVWDMMCIESFAWNYSDSLKLNRSFSIREADGGFNMAQIGTYDHDRMQVCWSGISSVTGELCAVIGYRALYNKLELSLGDFSSHGSEQYWGNTWVSLENKGIVYAEMYSDTYQEINIPGMAEKMQVKTVRELKVEKIR